LALQSSSVNDATRFVFAHLRIYALEGIVFERFARQLQRLSLEQANTFPRETDALAHLRERQATHSAKPKDSA
jgi:hypothetical protein